MLAGRYTTGVVALSTFLICIWFLDSPAASFSRPAVLANINKTLTQAPHMTPPASHLDTNAPSPSAARLRHWPIWSHVRHAFIFGDSYTDAFYDAENGPHPTAERPYGNNNRSWPPGPPDPKWPTFLTGHLRQPGGHNISTFNFAVSGSSVTESTSPYPLGSDIPGLTPFDGQVTQHFLRLCSSHTAPCAWTSETSIVFVFSGINSVLAPFFLGTEPEPEKTLLSYLDTLQRMYTVGARNFVLFTIPPLDLIDTHSPGNVTAQKKQDVIDFNTQLRTVRNSFMHRFPDVTVRLFDAFTLYHDILANVDAFSQTKGITILTQGCDEYAGL